MPRFYFGLFMGLAFWQQIALAHSLTCNYKYDAMDLATVQLTYLADGSLQTYAQVTMQGQKHTESVTKVAVAANEREHLWLSKESTDNSVELIVYLQPQAQGISEMINHHVPFGQDVWGNCTSADD
jgi:hypothetical protein